MRHPLEPKKLTKEEFHGLLLNGFAIDARTGGYVIGRSHEQGGIKCFIEIEDGFELVAEIEGGEYIINGKAATEFEEQLTKLNALYEASSSEDLPLCLTEYSTVFNTQASQQKILWVSAGGFIMNKFSAKIYFQIIERINFIANPLRHYPLEE